MITREPTFKDYAKLAELSSNAEFVAQWMLHCKDNTNCISLVTIEKKEVIAVFFGEYLPEIERIETMLLIFPDENTEIGKFLLNKAVQYFIKVNKNVQDLQIIGLFKDNEQYQKMNMKPYETMYRMELNK